MKAKTIGADDLMELDREAMRRFWRRRRRAAIGRGALVLLAAAGAALAAFALLAASGADVNGDGYDNAAAYAGWEGGAE